MCKEVSRFKPGSKVMYCDSEWYYVGLDIVGDHLLSKGYNEEWDISATTLGFTPFKWTWTSCNDGIKVIGEITKYSILEQAIHNYMELHDIVGTRPFKVLLSPDKGLPSTYLRFNGTTLEYQCANGWNKSLASDLCDLLFDETPFLYLKGDEPSPVLFKVGDKVIVEHNGEEIEGTIVVFEDYDGTYLVHSPLIRGHRGGTQNNNNNLWFEEDDMRLSYVPITIGDTVIILPRKDGQENQLPYYTCEMSQYAGTTFTVKSMYGDYVTFIGLRWRQDWLERV